MCSYCIPYPLSLDLQSPVAPAVQAVAQPGVVQVVGAQFVVQVVVVVVVVVVLQVGQGAAGSAGATGGAVVFLLGGGATFLAGASVLIEQVGQGGATGVQDGLVQGAGDGGSTGVQVGPVQGAGLAVGFLEAGFL